MISGLKKDLPKAKSEGRREYGFDSLPNSKMYETKFDRKKKRREFLEDYIDYWGKY